MHRKSVLVLAVGALAALPMLASAQTADAAATPPAPNLTGNVSITTNYKFRGQD
ncbi:TorF family putative porin, partial [Variovorax sp. GT1P44]